MILASFLLFTLFVAACTWRLTRGGDHYSTDGYFLAGRSLTAPFIAGSLLLTNLSTEQLVGLNGAAFTDGLSVMAWEVVAALSLVLLALWFLPRYLKSGIATIPEFLEQRFGRRLRTATTVLFILAYAFILLPIILYTGATGLIGILDIPSLTGIENNAINLWITVWLIGILGSLYAIKGGLRVVAVSDTLNGLGLLIGGVLITLFGLQAIAGEEGTALRGLQDLYLQHPDKFKSLGREDQSVPWHTLFSGVLLLNLFYWTTNQQIIQRTFGARNLAEGQKGVLLAGALKILAPLIVVFPGMIAFHLFAEENLAPDQAYGRLVHEVLPESLTGFFAAVVVGAILSSFNSALNSVVTLFSLGLYKSVWKPQASHRQTVRSGMWSGVFIALLAMTTAPLLEQASGIFQYLQEMNAIYFIPLFSVVLVGLLNKTVAETAALWTLGFSLTLMVLGAFVWKQWIVEDLRISFFHYMGLVFLLSVVTLLILGKWIKRAEPFEQSNSEAVDLTPWAPARWVGCALVMTVVTIYLLFA